ncbi:DUF1189 domain-containing protein [Candidatus Woesearchaeota archaeon]|nr:DUF1189 domain-containing protein [Candidatus Woesearchaeota archaeon]
MGWKDFFMTIIRSLYPDSYKELSENRFTHALRYFPLALLLFFAVMCLMYIPAVAGLPGLLDEEFSKIELLKFTVEHDIPEALMIPKEDPFIIVDTSGEHTELDEESVLVTSGKIQYKPLVSVQEIKTSSEIDATEYKGNVVDLITVIFIFMIPSLMILMYLIFFVKFAAIIIITALIAFVIARIAKNEITFKRLLIVAVYASTIMMLVEVLAKPLGIGKWLITVPIGMGIDLIIVPIALYVIYLIIGTAIVGQREISYHKRESR